MLDSQREPLPAPGPLRFSSHTSLPQALVSPAVVAQRHWKTVRAGWLLNTPRPLAAQQQAARTKAAALGLAIETRDPQRYLGQLRLMFTIGGILITLAVIAIALVLLRLQTARDQQILTAVGAPRRTRRVLAATTATALAALGTVLGISGAYATLILAYSDTLGRLGNIPWPALTAIAAGIPALALATTWLTASGNHPRSTAPSSTNGLEEGLSRRWLPMASLVVAYNRAPARAPDPPTISTGPYAFVHIADTTAAHGPCGSGQRGWLPTPRAVRLKKSARRTVGRVSVDELGSKDPSRPGPETPLVALLVGRFSSARCPSPAGSPCAGTRTHRRRNPAGPTKGPTHHRWIQSPGRGPHHPDPHTPRG